VLIDPERIKLIPETYRDQHSFCFWLHDMMVDVMRQAEAARIANVTIQFKDEGEAAEFQRASDPITFCLENDRHDTAKRIVVNQTIIPLYADILHFVHGALVALERRKYAVAFALFRKPFKYSLIFAAWMLADEEDFFNHLRSGSADPFENTTMSAERRLDVLKRAVAKFEGDHFMDGQVIYDIAFERKNPHGLAGYFDMAAHLVTTYASIKTEALNLNFIFKNPSETDLYDGLYYLVAYLLVFLLLAELALIGQLAEIPSSYISWLSIATLGIQQALFSEESTALLDELNDSLADLMLCVLCNGRLFITRENALRFFTAEHINCTTCNVEQQFPLFWLMSRRAEDSMTGKSTS